MKIRQKYSVSKLLAASLGLSLAAIPLQSALAGSTTWLGNTSGVWSDSTNWAAGTTPGDGETATFNGASTNTTLDLGTGGVTIGSVLFDTSSAAAYTIGVDGSQVLTLSNAGSITLNPTVAANQLINSAVVLGTDGSAQTFTLKNNSTTNSLTVAGGITGSTGAGIKTLAVTGAGATTLSGVIGDGSTGSVALTKSGAGTLTLAGANTYTGLTSVNQGTLSLTGALASTGTLSMGGGTFSYDAAGTNTQSFATTNIASGLNYIKNTVSTDTLALGAISRTAGASVFLTKTGAITTSTPSSDYTWRAAGCYVLGGNIVIDNGNNTYDFAQSGLSGVNNITAAPTGGGGNGNAGNVKYTSGNNSFNVNGSWVTINLQGASTVLNINGTQVYLDEGGIILSGGATLAGSKPVKSNAGAFYVHVPDSGTINAVLGAKNTEALYKDGPGLLTLGGNNSYTGGTVINQGTVRMNYSNSVAATGTITLNGGKLEWNDSADNWTQGAKFVLQADSTIGDVSAKAINWAGTMTGNGHALNYDGSGNRTYLNGAVSGLSQINVLTSALGFDLTQAGCNNGGSAPVNISNGASLFICGAAGKVVDNPITLNGGTGKGGVGAIYAEVGSPVLSGQITLASGNSAFGGVSSTTGTITGKVTGAGGLTKSGTGGTNTWVLSNANNDYAGPTAVNVGTLTVNGGLTGSGDVTVASGATLNGTGSVAGATGVNGTLSGSIAMNGDLTIGTTGAMNGSHILGGNVTLNNSTLANVASDITVAAGKTLSGIGGSTGVVTGTAAGSTIAPGNSGAGNLRVGSLTISTGAHLSLDILGNTVGSSDLATATSAVSLSGGDLSLNIGSFVPDSSTIYLIVNSLGGSTGTAGTTGAFDSISITGFGSLISGAGAEGSQMTLNGQDYMLTYAANYEGSTTTGGNDVALVAVPEPSTWAILLGGFGMLGFFQKLRARRS